MVSKRLHIMLFLIGLASVPAFAADNEVVAIHGFDKMSCDDWNASKDDADARALYIAWMRGIVTGYNFANPDNQVALGRMPGDFSLTLFVDSYCRQHKTKSFAGAAFELIAQKRGSDGLSVISTDAPEDAGKTNVSKTTGKAGSDSAGNTNNNNANNTGNANSTSNTNNTGNDSGYDAWLRRQSDDMRSLDPKILHNIYKKETAAKQDK